MHLTLNDKLKESEYYKPRPKKDLVSLLKTKELTYVEDNLAEFAQRNYLDYLLRAWDAHFGIVISPDIIWYTLLCELTGIVATNSDTYRGLFTTSDKKEEVIVMSGSLTVMPLDVLVMALKERVPSDIDTFMPEFTTSTERATLSRYAAFCDMASPYYHYGMFLCGFPAIDVQGEKLDWERVSNSWKSIGKLFHKHANYVAKVQNVLDEIVVSLSNSEYWKKMFVLDKCGSGHQYLTSGWLTTLFTDEPDVRYPENYASHVSIVKYKQINTNKQYDMKQGLFSSKKENGFLIPEFGHIVYERQA